MSRIIKLIVNENSEKVLADSNIQNIIVPNKMFHITKFDSYEIDFLDKKYLVKKFKAVDVNSLPSGLSTAYLNINGNFISTGYMALCNAIEKYNGLLFLSVEEKMDDFLRTDNFEIFIENEDQVLWFFIDFLHILDRLDVYKIKLTTPALLFSVKKDDKRWRFRIDDIGYFRYVDNESKYENHKFLINILDSINNIIKKQTIHNYINRLIKYANELINAEHPYYIEMLISKAEQEISII